MNWSAPIHTSLQPLLPSLQPGQTFHIFFFLPFPDGWEETHWFGAFSQRVHVHMHTFVNEIKYRSAGTIICPRRSSQCFPVILNYKVKQDRLNSKTRATYEASRHVFSHAEKMWWWWPARFDWEHHSVSGFCLSCKLLP